MLKWLEIRPELRCKRIKKNGEQCKKAKAHHCSVCASHGAHKIRYGKLSPNFKNGSYSKEAIQESKEVRARLGYLQRIGEKYGFLPKKRGRKLGG